MANGSRLLKFLLIRIKTIFFRIFNIIGVLFDIYAVNMKFKRGHYLWVFLSILCLVFPAFVGSMYSLYFFIRDKEKNNQHDFAIGKLVNREGHPSSRNLSSISEAKDRELEALGDASSVVSDDTTDSVILQDNGIVQDKVNFSNGHTTNGDVYNTIEKTEDIDVLHLLSKNKVLTRNSRLRKPMKLRSNTPALKSWDRKRKKFLRQGTQAEVQIKGDLTHNTCTRQLSQDTSNTSTLCQEFTRLINDFREFLPSNRRTVLFHCLLLSREFRFCSTSLLLWNYIISIPEDPEGKAPIKALERKHVKQICVIQKWYDFVKAEATTRQINLFMSTLENVLMTMIQLLYWSNQSDDTVTPDPLELVSIITALIQIAYNIVTTYNHQRELNCLKEDISLLHKIWQTIAHMFLIASRMLSFYTFLCLGAESLVFLLTILSMQLLNYINSVRDNHSNNTTKSISTASIIVSSILLIFIYAPASTKSSQRTITMNSYKKNMLLESIWIVVFSIVHLTAHSNDHFNNMTWMTMKISLKCIIIGYSSALLCYILGISMSFCSSRMFKYDYVTESHIIKSIYDVNKEFGTEFKFLKNDLREAEIPRIFGDNCTLYYF